MKSLFISAAIIVLAPNSVHAEPQRVTASDSSCINILPQKSDLASGRRDVTPMDIARLRDFGDIELAAGSDTPVAISPDAKQVALQLKRADPERNAYCIALVQIDLVSGKAEIRDLGYEFVPAINDHGPHGAYHDGYSAHLTPRWSPQGNWVAYLKRVNGVTQLWRVPSSGGTAELAAAVDEDILDFGWTDDGSGVVFSTMPELAQRLAEIEQEGLSGFHYDDRYYPSRSNRPLPRSQIPRRYSIASMADGKIRAATDAEAKMIASAEQRIATDIIAQSRNRQLDVISIKPRSSAIINSPMRLDVKMADGRTIACELSECSQGVFGAWWSSEPGEVIFLRREGQRGSRRVFYGWQTKTNLLRRLLATEGVITGCQQAAPSLICAFEDSAQPRILVSVDTDKGTIEPIFDPNPEFRNIHLGKIERFFVTNKFGKESFVDFVLPPKYKPGQKLPLVVIGYSSRGFLRGGVGDEYPIHAFAARGFAVLSYERPLNLTWDEPAVDIDELVRRFNKDWADRRSVVSTIEMAIDHFVKRGFVDTSRMGITGFSDGSVTAVSALLGTKLFAAAALSSCCEGPASVNTALGPYLGDKSRKWGYPSIFAADAQLWKPISLAGNADHFSTPLLLQQADREYQFALEAYAALKSYDRPVDLFVFPNEYHVKWQPAHRLAIYERSLDWFDFWLRDIESTNPARSEELNRWRNWRDKSGRATAKNARGH